MTVPPTALKEFRIEFPGNGLAHIVFDAPGRTMNVFSEAAIIEIGMIARWLEQADVRGALIRSGKTTGFCAGANLSEIWAAYDTIMATPNATPLLRCLRSFLPPEPRAARARDLRQAGRGGDRRAGAWRRRRTCAGLALSRADRRQARRDRSAGIARRPASRRGRHAAAAASRRGRARHAAPSARQAPRWRARARSRNCSQSRQSGRGCGCGRGLASRIPRAGPALGPRRIGPRPRPRM